MAELLYRKLDEDGDMVMGGSGAFLTGVKAMAQAIKTRLLLFDGEWWEDTYDGLPMMTDFLGRPRTEANRKYIDLLMVARIADTVGVVRVKDVVSRFVGRVYEFRARVETIYGETEVEVAL